jgi:hypothetical protein
MTTIEALPDMPPLIRWRNLWWVGGALGVMGLAIWSEDVWFLNFVHVFCGLLWTGIDLFMGFVIGPILRHLDLPARRAITLRLMPRMIFLMPTLSIVTGTAGWSLADRLGYLGVAWPQQAWVTGALVILIALTLIGVGILLPTNVRICLELQKLEPDAGKLTRWMRRYLYAVGVQGILQVAIIVIMARFVSGL